VVGATVVVVGAVVISLDVCTMDGDAVVPVLLEVSDVFIHGTVEGMSDTEGRNEGFEDAVGPCDGTTEGCWDGGKDGCWEGISEGSLDGFALVDGAGESRSPSLPGLPNVLICT